MRANEPPRIARFFSRILLGAALWGTATVPAWAQGAVSTRPVSVVVAGGASVPVGGFKDYNDLGVHADVSLLLRFAGQSIRLRPEFSYARFNVKSIEIPQVTSNWAGMVSPNRAASATAGGRPTTGGQFITTSALPPPPSPLADGASTLLGLLGNIEVPLAGGLYVIGGVGATNVKSGASSSANDVSQTALTYNGGAGIRFRLGGISGFIEGRLKDIAVDQGRALFSDVKTVPVSFGLVF